MIPYSQHRRTFLWTTCGGQSWCKVPSTREDLDHPLEGGGTPITQIDDNADLAVAPQHDEGNRVSLHIEREGREHTP